MDAIAQNTCGGNISQLLSALDEAGACPKTILYSLNPADMEFLGSIVEDISANNAKRYFGL